MKATGKSSCADEIHSAPVSPRCDQCWTAAPPLWQHRRPHSERRPVFRCDGGEAIRQHIVRSIDNSGFSHVGIVDITPEGTMLSTPPRRSNPDRYQRRETAIPFDFLLNTPKTDRLPVCRTGRQRKSPPRLEIMPFAQPGTPFSINPQDGLCLHATGGRWQSARSRSLPAEPV